MVDIDKQVAYWRGGAQEDWAVAQELVRSGRARHGLFFAHLALEKVLKAHVCRQMRDLAPRLHNLIRLAELAGIALSQAQIDVLAEMNAFNIEGRYPDTLTPPPRQPEALEYLARAGEVFNWLTNQL
ncbi:MAG TPA: HEPN domain-containing protein [Anaerolineae bacterium]